MRHLDYDREFYWYIDASYYGYSIAVYQEDLESKEIGRLCYKPVMFLSRKLKSAKKQY